MYNIFMTEPQIIFEDDDILVINKPSGWITNDASTTKDQPVLQGYVRQHLGISKDDSQKDTFRSRDGIVHRLDKETSGCIVVAKNEESFKNLQKQFKERIVKKKYIALTHGIVEPEEGSVEAPVGRLPWRRDRFGVLPGGRSSHTDYETNGTYVDENGSRYSLLSLFPKTGRTHQIRIHMKHIGHPLVADDFYAGRKTARDDRQWCPRLFLHASEITFNHPTNGKSITYKADLHADLDKVLQSLKKI